MKVLITGIGGPTPRSIARAIRRIRPEAKILGVDSNPKALGFYMPGLLDASMVVPRASESARYFQDIQALIRDHEIDCAIVQPEVEVIAWGEFCAERGIYPCPAVIPPLPHARALADKAAMSSLLDGTGFIPKTLRIAPANPRKKEIRAVIGYPCWIRASTGSGGYGSLKLSREADLDAWLYIHSNISEFTVSEFLPGKHLANQMLYLDGKLQMNAGLECIEYVMADVAPSKVTGNTSYGRLVNDDALLGFCEEVMNFITSKIGVEAHGVYSFDLKLDAEGAPKVTEINVRHMAYTGILAQCGFDLVGATLDYLETGVVAERAVRHHFDEPYIFLRDVDVEPIVLRESDLLTHYGN